jgi:hypothetical protein
MYCISVNKNRPDYRVFIDLLYGAKRNVDTDGDSNPVNSRTWSYLYIADRESDDPSVEIGVSEKDKGVFEVRSGSEELEALAALYLFLYCGASIKLGDCNLNQDEIEKLKERYATQLQRAEKSIWHHSSNEKPYPNIA